MPSKLEPVPAGAGKRLGAAALGWLPPVTVHFGNRSFHLGQA
ncbi:hypothetical protein J2X01_000634 [Arthrobacter ginsengisoli]|uniref:Uncharacterized protein n=1 Tax=Arthrobacter ginsengisoli TaxID=1356565 RepID=A0ABU1U832_9MICC|nr:hypothetical protein [Arthrobacter ginsengisoli]MDR7081357.1 hypothetical protein [Arthrobacter ginsengisoli]